ncbi:hypothetical protein P0W64_10580 [Tsukamurella sp. 8F]|uniref:hypothetical protein n=1 Tax=unclassified Tsukamurella TaxID=2633480 RepID=UPI0023B9593A|nr:MULTISPECIES: hypothetical protein [unclassified Tsukamurella]MDF0530010.1 hypothetical protein [Tsukamurella sp. 8J]MDF0587218.1 hypothetical protein [Tsukamurella sp. 8F]
MTAGDVLEQHRTRLEDALAATMTVRRDAQSAVMIEFGDTPGSVQAFELAPGLEVYSLTQVIAWDLPLTDELRGDVESSRERVQFGTLKLIERDVSADLVLHYSFPAGTLDGEPLREFVLFVLAQGFDARNRLVG